MLLSSNFNHLSAKIYHEAKCSICFEEYDEDEKKNECTLNDCGHIFHKACIDRWMSQNPTCPLCHKKIDFLDINIIIKHAVNQGRAAIKSSIFFIRLLCVQAVLFTISVLSIEKILTICNLRPSWWPTTPEEIEAYNKMIQEIIAKQSFKPLELNSIKDVAFLVRGVALIVLVIGVAWCAASFVASYLEKRKVITVKTLFYKPEIPV